MKTLKILLAIAFVMLTSLVGFSQDDKSGHPKRAAVPIPFKGTTCIVEAVQDLPVDGTPLINPVTGQTILPQLFLVSKASISGHSTLMGNSNGTMIGVSAHLDMGALSQGRVVMIADYYGTITAANGDQLDFESSIEIDVTGRQQGGGILSGTITLTGGTGRFANATGSGVCNGIIPCWTMEGTLEFSR